MHHELLRQLYKKHKIQKRSITITKKMKNMDEAKFARELSRIKRELAKAKKDGYRIIYLDETMFTRKTQKKTEYCLPK